MVDTRALGAGRHAACLIAALLLLAGGPSLPATAGAAAAPGGARRVVAIGDLHADIGAARSVFRMAGATDARDNWIGGDLVVVQVGDLIGRGDDDREVLDFIFDVRAKARAGGGTVHVLVGNHEVFGARLELRWVSGKAFKAFDTLRGLDLTDPRLAGLERAERARGAALLPGGFYARRIAEFPAVLRLGETIFVHGGVTPQWAAYGIDRINDEVRRWLTGQTDEPAPTQGLDDGSSDDGVMWSRHYGGGTGDQGCAMLAASLKILKARRMVVGHTVRPSIGSRCDGQVWAIDVGISRYYGGAPQVLEIVDDAVMSVITTSGRRAPASATASARTGR